MDPSPFLSHIIVTQQGVMALLPRTTQDTYYLGKRHMMRKKKKNIVCIRERVPGIPFHGLRML